LLTNYGVIDYLIMDSWGWSIGYTDATFERVRDYVRARQPWCIVVENNHENDFRHTDILVREATIEDGPGANNDQPFMTWTTFTESVSPGEPGWFWHPGLVYKDAATVISDRDTYNGRNSTMHYSFPVNRLGRIDDELVTICETVGADTPDYAPKNDRMISRTAFNPAWVLQPEVIQ
jgi:hypothetical protein